MSNKNYKNYNNYNNYSSTKTAEEIMTGVSTEEVEDTVEEVKNEETVAEEAKSEEPTQIVEETKPEPVPTPVVKPEPKPITGIVTGCIKLNVRKEPNKDAEIVSVINEGSEVIINKNKSTVDFYAVCTAAGVDGYCMKKFIMPVK